MLGLRNTRNNRDFVSGSFTQLPKEDIPTIYGIFDAYFLPQDKVRSMVYMNPSHPQSIERIEIDKYFKVGQVYLDLFRKTFKIGSIKIERKSEINYDG